VTQATPNPPTTPEQFRRRLGYYMVGLAVGCVLVGMLQYVRSREAARIRAENEAAAQGFAEPASAVPATPNPAPR